jgi:hypothetical protein
MGLTRIGVGNRGALSRVRFLNPGGLWTPVGADFLGDGPLHAAAGTAALPGRRPPGA